MHSFGTPSIQYASLESLQETGSADVVTSTGIMNALAGRLPGAPATLHIVTEASLSHWEMLLHKVRGEIVYAIGGGLAVDAAKYVAAKVNCPLVCVPTAISVDAFLTWASGYREGGCVRYIETKPPDRVVVDLDLIASGPQSIRSAGVTDVLSIATGRWDWKFADLASRNPEHMAYDASIDKIAAVIEGACLACAASAGRGEPSGLRRLLECLAMEVQLCNLIGHSRPEEGSEHYFAYAAESVLGKGLPHGDLVGPGILIMAFLQGQDIVPLKEAMQAANVPLTTIPMAKVREILHLLPEYCQRHSLPYGIAHTLTHRQVDDLDPTILA